MRWRPPVRAHQEVDQRAASRPARGVERTCTFVFDCVVPPLLPCCGAHVPRTRMGARAPCRPPRACCSVSRTRLRRLPPACSASVTPERAEPVSHRAQHPAVLLTSCFAACLALSGSPAAHSASLADACQTDACREILISPKPNDSKPSLEERRLRRIRAVQRDAELLAQAAREAREREALQPAYEAKAAAEVFELNTARKEGASEEEAQARAERAGRLAFATASGDVEALKKEEEAFQARQAAKRAAAAAAAEAEAETGAQ